MFCCHGNVILGQQYSFLFLACVNQVLNCKYSHLIFCHEKICSEMVFQVYSRQFDGVVAMVT